MLISPRSQKKVITDYVSEKYGYGKALLIFNHGLGDLINFLPLLEELKRNFTSWKFDIGTNRNGFKYVLPIVPLNSGSEMRKLMRLYNYLFTITYPEPPHNNYIPKPYYCNNLEIGLQDFKWEPYKLPIYKKSNDNLIGVHFFGNTNQNNKSLDDDLAERVWNDLIKFGYEPFEIHNCNYNDTKNGNFFIKEGYSLRFENPNLGRFIEKISECKYFIGIDSGPLYLAGSIIGLNNCIGLEKNYPFDKYLPYSLDKIDIKNYKSYKLKQILKRKEK